MIPERQSFRIEFRSRGKFVNIASANMLKSLRSGVRSTTHCAQLERVWRRSLGGTGGESVNQVAEDRAEKKKNNQS